MLVFFIIRPPVEYYRQYYAQYVSNKILYDIREESLFAFTKVESELLFKYACRGSHFTSHQ